MSGLTGIRRRLRSRWLRLVVAVSALGVILWAANSIWTDLNYFVERMGVR